MNAMAAVGAVRQAPEIIVVNDGKPVEDVGTKSRAIKYAKLAGMALVPLILGIAVGQISNAAKLSNLTIDDAAYVRDDIKRLRTQFYDKIHTPLLLSKERGPGGQMFKLNDEELTAALLDKASMPEISTEVFKTHLYELEPTLVHDILTFYAKAQALNDAVKVHAEAAKNDQKAIKDGADKRAQGKPDENVNAYMKDQPYRYAVVIEMPTKKEKDVQFGARIVEVGPPVCAGKKGVNETSTCEGGPPVGFGVREQADGEGWSPREIVFAPEEEKVPGKKLIPITPTRVFEDLLKGGESATAEVSYMRRVIDLEKRAAELIELGVFLEGKLNAKANEGKSFTFFL